MNGWKTDFQELLCGFWGTEVKHTNQQLLCILSRYSLLHQLHKTQAFIKADNIFRQPYHDIHFCSHLSAVFPGSNGVQKCWVSLIISNSESIRMRLGRLHSFSPARTIDLTSNHVIRHTVLSLYLLGIFLVNISHNASALWLQAGMRLADMLKIKQGSDRFEHTGHTGVISRLLIFMFIYICIYMER